MPEAAKAPEARTVTLDVPGLEGWRFTARTDFTVREFQALDGGWVGRATFLDAMVVEHNFPDRDGKVAGSMFDVVPARALVDVLDCLVEAITNPPNE